MNLTIISYFVAAAIGFGSAWQIQTWRALEDENHRITAAREAEQEVSRMEQKRSAAALAAANAAKLREVKLGADAAAAHAAADSLRNTLHDYVQRASADPAACADATSTLSGLLNQCADRYRGLGEVCSRHVSDIKTLVSTIEALR